MYHDVVQPGEWNASGFPGIPASLYKLDRQLFADHVRAIAERTELRPVRITDVIDEPVDSALLLTFDDGGESAYTIVAGMLEDHGWRGHFFVTTNYIDSPAFLTRAQLLDLHRRGHLIGSHTAAHLSQLARCSQSELESQWQVSIDVLSDIIGERVETASVPGGQYCRAVATAAAATGIRVLFTSEPTTVIHEIGSLRIIGRFTVQRHTSATTAALLARGDRSACAKQQLAWRAKQAAKTVGKDHYLALRRAVLQRLGPRI